MKTKLVNFWKVFRFKHMLYIIIMKYFFSPVARAEMSMEEQLEGRGQSCSRPAWPQQGTDLWRPLLCATWNVFIGGLWQCSGWTLDHGSSWSSFGLHLLTSRLMSLTKPSCRQIKEAVQAGAITSPILASELNNQLDPWLKCAIFQHQMVCWFMSQQQMWATSSHGKRKNNHCLFAHVQTNSFCNVF